MLLVCSWARLNIPSTSASLGSNQHWSLSLVLSAPQSNSIPWQCSYQRHYIRRLCTGRSWEAAVIFLSNLEARLEELSKPSHLSIFPSTVDRYWLLNDQTSLQFSSLFYMVWCVELSEKVLGTWFQLLGDMVTLFMSRPNGVLNIWLVVETVTVTFSRVLILSASHL